jgi:hypothetical protein
MESDIARIGVLRGGGDDDDDAVSSFDLFRVSSLDCCLDCTGFADFCDTEESLDSLFLIGTVAVGISSFLPTIHQDPDERLCTFTETTSFELMFPT